MPERRRSETPGIRSSSLELESQPYSSESESSLIMTEKGSRKTFTGLRRALQDRQILLDPSNSKDKRLEELQGKLKAKLKPQSKESTVQLLERLKSGIVSAMNSTSNLMLLDALLMQLDQFKSEIRYPFSHPKYFKSQLKKCASRSEHVLQRTVMMNLFHTYWLPKIFEWNTEGLWEVDPGAQVFLSSKDETFTRPKPDLSFGFAQEAFTDKLNTAVAVPGDLEVAISPDGYRQQVFPFLFVEVKKGGWGLEEAKLENLRTAARALYNIHRWFERAKHCNLDQDKAIELNQSFHGIRVFTFTFNASELVVRVHRAEILRPGTLGFPGTLAYHFADFFTVEPGVYTRDQICNLFNNIISDYAAEELFPMLQAVYEAVLDGALKTIVAAAPSAGVGKSGPDQQAGRSDNGDADEDRQEYEKSSEGVNDEEHDDYPMSPQRGHFSQGYQM